MSDLSLVVYTPVTMYLQLVVQMFKNQHAKWLSNSTMIGVNVQVVLSNYYVSAIVEYTVDFLITYSDGPFSIQYEKYTR